MKDIESLVCEDIKERQRVGIKKYGVTVADQMGDGTRKYWLRHAYQEALDLAIYLRRELEEKD